MESAPFVSFNDKGGNGSTIGPYIGKVLLGSFPKMMIIVSKTIDNRGAKYHRKA